MASNKSAQSHNGPHLPKIVFVVVSTHLPMVEHKYSDPVAKESNQRDERNSPPVDGILEVDKDLEVGGVGVHSRGPVVC